MSKLKIAGVQFTGTDNINENLASLTDYINQAVEAGCDLIVLPEICNIVQGDREKLKSALENDQSNFVDAVCELANSNNVMIHIGSVAELNGANMVNRSYLIANNGEVVATYDKIHMFDVELSDTETYKESDSFCAGDKSVNIDMLSFNYGMTICYDVRFPQLFQKLALNGADVIGVPACFTQTTGQAHWEVLVRARAIETGCFIVAVGQTGSHSDGRRTYGHSMIVNPWGEVVASLGAECGLVIADIDTAEVEKTRQRVPNLKNIRKFS